MYLRCSESPDPIESFTAGEERKKEKKKEYILRNKIKERCPQKPETQTDSSPVIIAAAHLDSTFPHRSHISSSFTDLPGGTE